MKQNLSRTMLTCSAYCLDKELWKAIDYLKEQVRVLKEQHEEDDRILLDNHQRIRLAAKAKQLTRKLLEETKVLFTPDALLGWYRKLVAQKADPLFRGAIALCSVRVSRILPSREDSPGPQPDYRAAV